MEKFYSLCLQGKVKAAMEYLNSIRVKTEDMIRLEKCMNDRFFSDAYNVDKQFNDKWIENVIVAYHHYFRAVLLNHKIKDNAEIVLRKSLADILQIGDTVNIDSIEQKLSEVFLVKGYFFLGGVTPPFRGPYVWGKMEKLQYEVEIPAAIQRVTVNMMSDFLLESWISFATCEQKTVGGWAKDGELYCNAKRYKDRNGEAFQIFYLKHEAQHLYDLAHFPKIKPIHLEYRAKLVELIYSTNHSILRKFLLEASNDEAFPHSFASYLIIKRLSGLIFDNDLVDNIDSWLEVEYKRISSLSTQLFEESTKEVEKLYT
ncbi:hypothetical protein [Virgibacillus senegalensis]|uniref:hypothetical protein n=1 Tax=Virgibacillus senegalensis TaxID=1499679 RepID=UPI00069D403D|nr:hypothetical protein [Virgibacillus senegalensis]